MSHRRVSRVRKERLTKPGQSGPMTLAPYLARALPAARRPAVHPAVLASLAWCYGYAVLAVFIGDTAVPGLDLPAFFYAADATFNWGLSPYDAAVIRAWQEDLGRTVFPFLYPPPALLLFAPLAALSYSEAALLLLLVNSALLVALEVALFNRFLRSLPAGGWFWLGLGVLCLHYGFVRTLLNGQVNLLVLGLILVAWDALGERRRPVLAGLALALAILLKTYPALLLALLLLRREWSALAAAFATIAAGAGAAALLLPPELWGDWLRRVLPTGGWGTVPFMLFAPSVYANIGLNGFFSRLIAEETVVAGLAWLILPVIGFSLHALWSRRTAPPEAFYERGFTLLLAAGFLVAPLSWFHHLLFLLPGMLLLLREAAAQPGPGRRLGVGSVLTLSFYWAPLGRQIEIISTLPSLAAIALWLALLRSAYGQGRH